MSDPIVDEAARRIMWSHYGLDNYEWFVYYEASENKPELRSEYTRLKKEFLGPYFKESDEFELAGE